MLEQSWVEICRFVLVLDCNTRSATSWDRSSEVKHLALLNVVANTIHGAMQIKPSEEPMTKASQSGILQSLGAS